MSGSASSPWGSRQTVLLAAALVLAAFFAVISEEFRSPSVLLDQSCNWVEVGILAPAMLVVILIGGIDLSVASILALVGVSIVRLHAEAGLPIWFAAAAGLAIGAAAGALNGWIMVAARIPDLVVTLATMAIYRGLAQAVAQNRVHSGLPESYRFLGDGLVAGVPAQWLVLIAVWAVLYTAVHHGRFGRTIYGTGSSERAARLARVPTARVRVMAYALSGLAAAVAAILFTARSNTARSDDALGFELDAITCVVLGGASIAGGRGSVPGVFLGFVGLGLLRTGLDLKGVDEIWQRLTTGAMLIAVAALNERIAAARTGRRRGSPAESPASR
ncbi:MAG: ABC transporter permease [Planctomycetes bacterium]|nr:ABC transporter permease [Planctomycetota bacterium]